ncbi:MAG: T9SS type A sorting domain-containing protein [Rhodothermales bacterium]
MRRRNLVGLIGLGIAAILCVRPSYGQIRLHEVGYSGVDYNDSSRWVELRNTGDADFDVSSFWLCNYPNYVQISDLTILSGSTTIAPGEALVVAFDALGNGDGELGLYSTNTFADSSAIVDYMQYGSSGHMRESVAVAAGIWDAGTFVPAADMGQSLAFVGYGATTADRWRSSDPTPGEGNGADPESAPEASIDRFSEAAGTLFIRNGTNGLPGPNEPIDFDQGEPFVTMGLGPHGEFVRYYNFDAQPQETAPIFALFREGEDTPVAGQMNIVNVIPGDEGYNDFWHVHKVTVPSTYVANSITSVQEIMDAGLTIEKTNIIVNCPIVPDGSTASMRLNGEDDGLVMGWYQGQVVYYFQFAEAPIMVDPPAEGHPLMPVSPIYVSFNINPGEEGGGPPSGFKTEEKSSQAHNVVATIPGDDTYSPLWVVNIYDNAEFDDVGDLTSAQSATILASGAALVNCPIVFEAGADPETAARASIDRFSEDAGTLFIRDESNGLPGPNEPIDFDQGEPFMTQGLGPNGNVVQYYNFDAQPTDAAPIYVLFREGEDAPVPVQLNIVGVIPGDEGYNDFWHVHRVTVPRNYIANTYTNVQDLMAAGLPIEPTNTLVNCPIVPDGSSAMKRLGAAKADLVEGWYNDQIIYYFQFIESALTVDVPETGPAQVPVSPIYVSFNINPGEEGGGPPSGFKTEENSVQTHNVVATLPDNEAYSPLWVVNIYDNADFESVSDLTSAQSATILAAGAALVNCPIVMAPTSTAVEPGDEVPKSIVLHANYPNPFNPETTIQYELDQPGLVTLAIYDMLGRKVIDLVSKQQTSGAYQVTWNGLDATDRPVGSGVYLYRLTLDGVFSKSRVMTLLK